MSDYRSALNLRLDLEKKLCEESLSQFFRSAWHIIEPSTPLAWNWHIDTICGYLEAVSSGIITRLIINVPPGTLKSSIVSVMFNAWEWTQRPDERYLCISNEQGLAIRDALKTKQIITSDWYQRNWPLSLQSDQNEKTLYANDKRGFRQSQGISAANTGKRGSCFVGSTLVSTEAGDIRIDDLVMMEHPPRVWSFNHDTQQCELKKIIATNQLLAEETVIVTTLSRVIICTPEHTIFTGERYERAENIAGRFVSVLQFTNHAEVREAGQVCKVRQDHANVHHLQKRISTGWRGVRQACAKGIKNWAVLLKNVRKTGTQSATWLYRLSTLRKDCQSEESKKEVLQSQVSEPSSFAHQKAAGQALRAMRSDDDNKQFKTQVLLDDVQKQSPLGKDARCGELTFSLNHGKGGLVSSNATTNKGKGRGVLRELWGNKIKARLVSTSHRLGRGKQFSGQSNNPMRLLPHENTQRIKTEQVIAVSEFNQDGAGKQCVYDIQVEGNNNFFANGILVHNCLIIDDPHDMKQVFSDVIRQGVLDTWDQSLSTRVNDPEKSAVILIMQRGHEADLTGHLRKKTKQHWHLLSIPMEYEGKPTFDAGKDIGRPELNDPRTKRGELLFPSRFTKRSIESLKEDLGEFGTAAQLQQRPVPSGGGIIKSHWWRIWPDDMPLPVCDHVFLSYDTAFSERDMKSAAYSAMTRWGVFWHEQRQRWCLLCLGVWYDRVGYDELRKLAKEWDKKYQPDAHLIEKKATGITLIQDLRRALPSKIRSYTPGRGDDKISRAHSVSPLFESGMIYIPNKSWAQNNEKTGVIDLVASFPNGAPPTADITDTVTQAGIYLRSGYWVSHPDDDDFDIEQAVTSGVVGDDDEISTDAVRGAYS